MKKNVPEHNIIIENIIITDPFWQEYIPLQIQVLASEALLNAKIAQLLTKSSRNDTRQKKRKPEQNNGQVEKTITDLKDFPNIESAIRTRFQAFHREFQGADAGPADEDRFIAMFFTGIHAMVDTNEDFADLLSILDQEEWAATLAKEDGILDTISKMTFEE